MDFQSDDDRIYHYLNLLGDGNNDVDSYTINNLIKLFGSGHYSIHRIVNAKRWYRARLLSDIQRLCRNYCKASVEITALESIVNSRKRNDKHEIKE